MVHSHGSEDMMDRMDAIEQLNRDMLPFATLLGIRFVSATPECVTAEMKVREDMCTRPAILHGGAMMALADTLGGCATSVESARRRDDHDDRIEDQLYRARRWSALPCGRSASRFIEAGARWSGRRG